MTLSRQFVFWSILLLAPVALLGGVSVWKLAAQNRALQAATVEYDAADQAQAMAVQVGWLRDSLRADGITFHDRKYFAPIQTQIEGLAQWLTRAAAVDQGDSRLELEMAKKTADSFTAAVARIDDGTVDATAGSTAAAAGLDRVHDSLLAIATLAPSAARRHVLAVSAGISQQLWWALLWLLIVLAFSASIHYKQYRALVKPLLWIRDEMRKSAASSYRQPVQAQGHEEFREVAVYFNGLARELAELYKGLEEKVITRSRELVRSERLASVGFLAAGVAHEINNPLSVISGYAELAGKDLQRMLAGQGGGSSEVHAQAEAELLASTLEAQGIIREEAFRCKEITSRLLSLARGGKENRERVCLNQAAQQVVALTKGLRNYRDRQVILDFRANDKLEVLANVTEIKQVLLNLIVNALEAGSADGTDQGVVRIGGRHTGEWAELFVQDGGKGMSAETLQQIFEPFFTAKRGAGEPGTGLGLSITHAIVESHGGQIRAESPGPGRGSRFTFRLPTLDRTPHETSRMPLVKH